MALLRLFEFNNQNPENHTFQGQLENIVVAHFDHALRESSAQDALFVQNLCQRLNISFYSERQMVANIAQENKWNLEDAS